MRPIPPAHRRAIDADPFFRTCVRRRDGKCSGRITIDHAFIYQGRQISEMWAYVPVCWFHHLGKGLDKHFNQRIALSRATPEDLAKYPRTNWVQLRAFLNREPPL